jgi:hypothetical protein
VSGSELRLSQPSAARTSGGLSSSRRAGINAHWRSAFRSTAGSGLAWSFLTKTGVTAMSVSTIEIRDLAAAPGHFMSM